MVHVAVVVVCWLRVYHSIFKRKPKKRARDMPLLIDYLCTLRETFSPALKARNNVPAKTQIAKNPTLSLNYRTKLSINRRLLQLVFLQNSQALLLVFAEVS